VRPAGSLERSGTEKKKATQKPKTAFGRQIEPTKSKKVHPEAEGNGSEIEAEGHSDGTANVATKPEQGGVTVTEASWKVEPAPSAASEAPEVQSRSEEPATSAANEAPPPPPDAPPPNAGMLELVAIAAHSDAAAAIHPKVMEAAKRFPRLQKVAGLALRVVAAAEEVRWGSANARDLAHVVGVAVCAMAGAEVEGGAGWLREYPRERAETTLEEALTLLHALATEEGQVQLRGSAVSDQEACMTAAEALLALAVHVGSQGRDEAGLPGGRAWESVSRTLWRMTEGALFDANDRDRLALLGGPEAGPSITPSADTGSVAPASSEGVSARASLDGGATRWAVPNLPLPDVAAQLAAIPEEESGVHSLLPNQDARLLWYKEFRGDEVVPVDRFMQGLASFLRVEKGALELSKAIQIPGSLEAKGVLEVLDRNKRDGAVHFTELRMAVGAADRLASVVRRAAAGQRSFDTLPSLPVGLMRRPGLSREIAHLIGYRQPPLAGCEAGRRCCQVLGPQGAGKSTLALMVGHDAATSNVAGGLVALYSDVKGLHTVTAAIYKIAQDLGIVLSDNSKTDVQALKKSLVFFLNERFYHHGNIVLLLLDNCERLVAKESPATEGEEGKGEKGEEGKGKKEGKKGRKGKKVVLGGNDEVGTAGEVEGTPKANAEADSGIGPVLTYLMQELPWLYVLATSREELAVPGSRKMAVEAATREEFEEYVAEALPRSREWAGELAACFGTDLPSVQAMLWLLDRGDPEAVARFAQAGASGGAGIVEAALFDLPVEARFGVARLCIFPGSFPPEAVQPVGGCSEAQLRPALERGLVRRNDFTGRYDVHDSARDVVAAACKGDMLRARDALMYHVGGLIERMAGLFNGAAVEAATTLLEDERVPIDLALDLLAARGAVGDDGAPVSALPGQDFSEDEDSVSSRIELTDPGQDGALAAAKVAKGSPAKVAKGPPAKVVKGRGVKVTAAQLTAAGAAAEALANDDTEAPTPAHQTGRTSAAGSDGSDKSEDDLWGWAGEGVERLLSSVVTGGFAALSTRIPPAEMLAAARGALAWSRAERPNAVPHGCAAHWVASILDVLGDHDRAHRYYREALEVWRATLGDDHPDTIATETGMAIMHFRNGNVEEALRMHRDVLAAKERTLGREHVDVADTLNHMAACQYRRGEYDKALKLYEEALEIRTEVLGEGHVKTASTLNGMAGVKFRLGDLEEAQRLYEDALRRRTARLGREHPATLGSLSNLAMVCEKRGDLERALDLYKEGALLYSGILGDDHALTVSNIVAMGNVLSGLGQLELAMESFEEALPIYERSLGRSHPHSASVIHAMALVKGKLGDLDAAAKLFEEALQAREAALGRDHPDTAETVSGLADVYSAQGVKQPGRVANALQVFEEDVRIKTATVGRNNPSTASAINNLAGVLVAKGEHDKALALFSEVLDYFTAEFGKEHSSTAAAVHNVAEVLMHKGDLDGARLRFEDALAIRSKVLGRNDPATADTMCGLADVLDKKAEIDEARSLFQEAHDVYSKAFGKKHADTVATKKKIKKLSRGCF